MEEIWKTIPDLPRYAISNKGRLRNTNTGRLLKTRVSRLGYEEVTISYNKVDYFRSIHRLVAEAFIPNPENKPQVNHIDEDKSNNMVSNLEWMTATENNNHGTRNERAAKSRSIPIIATNIKTGASTEFYGTNECARQLGLSTGNINSALKGRYKQTGGYTFKYKEV